MGGVVVGVVVVVGGLGGGRVGEGGGWDGW